MRCTICGKEAEYALKTWADTETNIWYCLHDSPNIGKADKLENARKENRERTNIALQMAADANQREAITNPDVTLSPIDSPGNRSQFGQGSLRVKKNVFENLKNRSPYQDN